MSRWMTLKVSQMKTFIFLVPSLLQMGLIRLILQLNKLLFHTWHWSSTCIKSFTTGNEAEWDVIVIEGALTELPEN